jgi:hypothetical protein
MAACRAETALNLLPFSTEHRKRHRARLFFLEGRTGNIDGTIRQAIERVRNARQLVYHLVTHGRPLQDHRPPAPELEHTPGRDSDDNEHDRQELVLTGNVDRSAKQM